MKKMILMGAAAALAILLQCGGAQAENLKCGLATGEKAAGEPLKIGAVVGRTGPDDFSHSAVAAQAYFDCVNDNGGINGRPIQYLVEDDKWNPETAAQVASKLVKDEKVLALVASGSFVEMGVNSKLYKDEGIMSMTAACAVSECFESSNIVSTNEGPLPSTIGAAQWAVGQGSKNVVCIGLTIPSVGEYSCGWMVKYMEAKGLQGSKILLDPASADMNAAVLQTVASGADTVLVNLPAGMAFGYLKVAEEQSLRDNYRWISSTPMYDESVPKALGEYWSGKFTTNAELLPIDGTGPDATMFRAVMDTYAKPENKRNTFAQAGFIAAKFFVDTALKLDPATIDRATMTKAIIDIKDYKSDMLCGPYYVGEADRHMPNHANVMMLIENGGYRQVSECTDVDSAYLDPIRANEKALGITP